MSKVGSDKLRRRATKRDEKAFRVGPCGDINVGFFLRTTWDLARPTPPFFGDANPRLFSVAVHGEGRCVWAAVPGAPAPAAEAEAESEEERARGASVATHLPPEER